MSINKSQADLLATAFLNTLGDSKDGIVPKETLSALYVLAGEFIEEAQDNLNQSNSNASGKLSASLKIIDPELVGRDMRVTVMMDFYGQFINKGVKGTKGGSGKYSFKNSFPNRKMVDNLLKGISRAKRSTTHVNPKKTISANEKKNATISNIDKAWGAARNIKMYGIKKTGFLDKAIVETQGKVKDQLNRAFKVDIINSLPSTLGNK